MTEYRVVYTPTAARQIQKLTPIIRVRILRAASRLAKDPWRGKWLKGDLEDFRCLRAGDYRIIYFVRRRLVQVEVIKVAHRREAYR